jgi:phosphoglycolate phosphatase-like HAD superfamily hydrolase
MTRPKTIMVDLDGTICTEERTFERPLATLIPGAREALERLRAAGHTIIVYTGRGWPEYRVTKQWIDDHRIPYDGIHMGKPIADVWIDDRALRFTNWADMLSALGA